MPSPQDFGDTYAFGHLLSPTEDQGAVQAAINNWGASGGDDEPEAQLYALDQARYCLSFTGAILMLALYALLNSNDMCQWAPQ